MKQKIRVISKNKKDQARARVLQAIMSDWLRRNPGLLEDINSLSAEIAIMNLKWGLELKVEDIFKKPKN